MMDFIIVTGKSGAGKSIAVSALEDIGYYCIDNLPPQLISSVAELGKNNKKFGKIAVVTDTRGGSLFSDLFSCLDELTAKDINYKILFITAEESELVRRYRETRRKHPLSDSLNLPITALVKTESQRLDPVLQKADYIIDTTYLRNAQLKTRITEIFSDDNHSEHLNICCMSFGFKYGTPAEADLVFDARCFPNPFYNDELRHLTGLNEPVRDFVLQGEEIQEFIKKLFSLIDFLLPLYLKEGKSQLVIAIGCTGGKHRSVVTAQMLYEHISENGYQVTVNHRDISKE